VLPVPGNRASRAVAVFRPGMVSGPLPQNRPMPQKRAAQRAAPPTKGSGCQTQLHFDPEQYQRLPGGQLWASAGMTVPSSANAESAKINFLIGSPQAPGYGGASGAVKLEQPVSRT
jgi:hypothetical protein